MSKTKKEKTPMGIDEQIKGVSMEFETIPPQKDTTKGQKPKIELQLLKDGDEYISIKAEKTVEHISPKFHENEEQK